VREMKILMILSNPFLVDPRVEKEARTLIEQGHEVTVIIWDRNNSYPKKEIFEGITLIRIQNKGIMRIIKGDLFRNPIWWIKAFMKGLELYNKGYTFDVIHCHDLDTLQTGRWLKAKLGCKLIYDAHELWGHLIEEDVPKFFVKFSFWFEKRLIKKVDHIITVSEPFYEYFKKIFSKKVTIVMNCKDIIYDSYEPTKNQTFTLIYIGGMKKRRFFPQIIDIIGEMKNVKLILAGKKEDLYFQMEEYSKKYSNIEFKGTIQTNQIIPLSKSADALFIIVDPKSKHYQKTLFNKQFEAMVCGRPIIITKDIYSGKMTEILQCGLTVNYEIKSVKKTIKALIDNPSLCKKLGINALKAAKTSFNWENEKKKLLRIYEEIK
jgi:glycosyltransferase involved in cell wall biosynthesis